MLSTATKYHGWIIAIFGSSHTAQRVTDRSASRVLRRRPVLKRVRYAARTAYNNISDINMIYDL